VNDVVDRPGGGTRGTSSKHMEQQWHAVAGHHVRGGDKEVVPYCVASQHEQGLSLSNSSAGLH